MGKDNAGAAAATANDTATSAEPTDADLIQILSAGNAPAAKPARAAAAESDESDEGLEGDEDLEADDEDAGDETDGEPAAADDAGADEGEDQGADEEEPAADDEPADDAAGEDDPDATLDEESRNVRAKFTPEQQSLFDKAVSKKTRRILELKTELREEQQAREAAESRAKDLEKSGPAAVTPTPDNPLGHIDDEAALEKELAAVRTMRRFALRNPKGAFVDKKTGELVMVEDPENPPEGVLRVSKTRIGEILAETEEMLQEHAPKRLKFLQDRAAAESQAAKEILWFANKKSQGYLSVEATLRSAGNTRLRDLPYARTLIADALVGKWLRDSQRQQQQNRPGGKPGKAGGKLPPKSPPAPGGGARPARVSDKSKAASAAANALIKTGDDPNNATLRAILKT